jgi:hypothetical protein
VNATFDLKLAGRLLRILKKAKGPEAQWPRVTAVGEHIVFESGAGLTSLDALVLEPGAFTTRRVPFERVLRTFAGAGTMTLQADSGRFRLKAFSGQLLDYDPDPGRPDGFDPEK